MIDLVFRNSTRERVLPRSFFERIVRLGLAIAGVRGRVALSINLVGIRRMRVLNRIYRKRDKATDVLSFPLGETQQNGYTERTLGDLFLCIPVARAAARREHIGLPGKMAWLTVHGLLHLLGYDHERSPHQAARMVALERKILNYGTNAHHRRH